MKQASKRAKSPHRKKLRGGQVVVPVNPLEIHIYVNFVMTGSTITSATTTDGRVSTGTIGPGTIQLNLNPPGSTSASAPALVSLKDFTLFAYNGVKWVEIRRTNLDMGGTTVDLYGTDLNRLIRKQQDVGGKLSEDEVVLPADVNAVGGVLNFANLNTSQFDFTPSASPAPNTANTYIQLVFTSAYQTPNTKFSGWNPASVAGLSLWLDSVEPGASGFSPNTGTPMTEWTDKSGRNNHGSSSSAPTYQVNPTLTGAYKMGMYLNGTSSFFSGSIKNDTNYCAVFSVVAPDAGVTTGSRIMSLGAAGINDTNGTNIYTNVVYNSTTTGANCLSSVGTVNNTGTLATTLVPIPTANSAFITTSVVTNNSVVNLANGTSTFLCRGFIDSPSAVQTLNVTAGPPGILYINSVVTGPYDPDTAPIQSGGQIMANTLISDMYIRTNGGLGRYTMLPNNYQSVGAINDQCFFAVSNTLPTSNIEWRSNLNLNTYSVGRNNSGANFFKGYVHEVLVYTRRISKQACQTIEGYLAWKWGLQANLPSTHPYKSVAPGAFSPSAPIPLIFDKFKPLLWLDAQDPQGNDGTLLPTPNTPMTGWYDKSGNNHHGVTISTFAPTYRANSVVFNGSTTLDGTNTQKVRPREIISDATTTIEQARSCIAFYPNGDAIITNSGSGMIKNVIGGTATTFRSGLRTPTGIAFDSKWNIYVVENSGHCIRRYGPPPDYNTNVVIAGATDGTSGVANEPYFTVATGYIASNILYVNSFTNEALLTNPIQVGMNVVSNNLSHGTISSFGPDTIGGIGTYNLIGNSNDVGSIGSPQTIKVFRRGGPIRGPQARFNRPSGITIDKNDIIYITDQNNHCIRRIYLNPNSDPTVADNWTVETIAGGWNGGTKTYGNQTGLINNVSGDTALFNSPIDITVDPTSRFLYVADKVNNRIRKINISTRMVSNCPVFTSTPRAITCDEFGILYIPLDNESPNRVEVYHTEEIQGVLINKSNNAGNVIFTESNSITYFNNTIYLCKENSNNTNTFYSLQVTRPTYLYSPVTTPISTFVNAFVVCTNSGFNRGATGILSLASARNVETYTGTQSFDGTDILLPEDAGPSSSYIGLYNYISKRVVTRKNTKVDIGVTDRPLLASLDITRPPDLLYVSSNSTSISIRVNGGTASTNTDTYLPFNIGAYGIGMQPSNIRRLVTLLKTNSAAAMKYSFDGYIYEVIVYTNEMTAAQSRIVEAYLSWKWRIPLLDTTNPYFTSATTPANPPVAYTDTVPTPITNMVFSNVFSNCVFTGSITGTTLTVTNVSAVSATNIGRIEIGAALNTSSGGTITAFVSGTLGGVGTYTVSVSQTVASGTIISSRNFSCIFIGSIASTNLTVTRIVSGTMYIGATLHTSSGGTIQSFVSGTNGGVGVYAISQSQTVSVGTSMTTSVGFTLSWKGGAQATNYRYALLRNNSAPSTPILPAVDFGLINQSVSYVASINRTSDYYDITVTPRNFAGDGTNLRARLVQTPGVPTRSAPSLTGFTITTPSVTEAASYNVYFDDVQYRKITSGTTAIFTNLLSGTNYLVTTTAVSNTGHESPPSAVLIARTFPTAPSNIVVSVWFTGGFMLTWSGAVGATSFTFTGATPTTLPVLVNGVSNNSARFTGLNSNTAYTITITAVNAGSDNSPTTGTIIIPVAPTLSSNSIGVTGFTLTFTTITDATSYNVYIGGIQWTSSQILPGGTVITGQSSGSILNVTVAAVVNGKEMWPSPVLSVMLPLPPLTNFRSFDVAQSGSEFKIRWLGGNGATSYVYEFGAANAAIAPGNGAATLRNNYAVAQRIYEFTGVQTNYTLNIQGRVTLGANTITTGTRCLFVGGISGTTLTVSQITSGTITVPSFLFTPSGGLIVSAGALNIYTVSISQTVATGTTIRADSATQIRMLAKSVITRTTTVPVSENGLTIDVVGSITNGYYIGKCNIYVSTGDIYYLVLANQAYGEAASRRYAINMLSTFTGTIASNSLTVTSVTSGGVYINAFLDTPPGVKITGFTSGTNGGVGVYTVTTSPNISTSTSFTARTSGCNLQIIARIVEESSGVEGFPTDPPFTQGLSPGKPFIVQLSFPNMSTNPNNASISWSGGDGATSFTFPAPGADNPPTNVTADISSKTLTCSFNRVYYSYIYLVANATGGSTNYSDPFRIPLAISGTSGLVASTARRVLELNYTFTAIGALGSGRPAISYYNIYVNNVLNTTTNPATNPTNTPTNTLINLPAGTGTARINVRAVDASGNIGFPSDTFVSTLGAPTLPVISTVTGTVASGFVMSWTGADLAESVTITYMSGAGPAQPTINMAAKTATFTGLSPRSTYAGTIVAVNGSGSSQAVWWHISTYIITTLVGNGTAGAGNLVTPGPATTRILNSPSGVAVDSSGNIYIADGSNHCVRKITGETISLFAGTGSFGVYSGSTANGSATLCALNGPCGVAVDSSGDIYIADTSNHCVRRVTSTGTISLFAGTGASGGGVTTAGLATSRPLNLPLGIAISSAGVYIVERANNCVRRVTGGDISLFAGTGTAGAYDATRNGGPATSCALNVPSGIAVDSSGNIYIADKNNNCIRKVTPGGTISLVSATGFADYNAATANGLASACQLDNPSGVAVDSAGNIYISDTNNDCIRRITPSGRISLIAGTGTAGTYDATKNGGPATSCPLNRPNGIAVDSSGNIYIADTYNHCIRKLS